MNTWSRVHGPDGLVAVKIVPLSSPATHTLGDERHLTDTSLWPVSMGFAALHVSAAPAGEASTRNVTMHTPTNRPPRCCPRAIGRL
jgi:hypothetical protein